MQEKQLYVQKKQKMASGGMFNLFVGQWCEQQNIYQEMCCRLMDLEPQWPLGRYFEVVEYGTDHEGLV